MDRFSLVIEKVVQNTPTCSTLVFKKPRFKKIFYHSGQYLLLKIPINQKIYYRAYSISSSPSIQENLQITIKRVPNGIVSNYILDELCVGDIIEVISIKGNFKVNFNNLPKEIYFWAGGSGITPIYSMICELLNKSSVSINLIYSSSTLNEVIFFNELLSFSKEFSSRFKLFILISREKASNTEIINYSRLNAIWLTDFLSKRNGINANHYICGPSGLTSLILENLSNIDIDSSLIFTENFNHQLNKRNLPKVIDSEVVLIHGNKRSIVHVTKGESILKAALDAGNDLPFACQNGNCQICKAFLSNGNTLMVTETETSKMNETEILLCCSYPISNEVEIKIEL